MGSVFLFFPSLMRYDVTAIKVISSLSFIVQYLKSKYKMLVIRGDWRSSQMSLKKERFQNKPIIK